MIDLQTIGMLATSLCITVSAFCVWLWCHPVDKPTLKRLSMEFKTSYEFFSEPYRFAYLRYILKTSRSKYEVFSGASYMLLWIVVASIEPFVIWLSADKPFTSAYYYARWKYAECSMYPQFWAMFIFIMVIFGAGGIFSMYIDSLPPPCQDRHDCQATQQRGIYTGDQHG